MCVYLYIYIYIYTRACCVSSLELYMCPYEVDLYMTRFAIFARDISRDDVYTYNYNKHM